MGAFHCWESLKPVTSASGLDHFEWEMKNFSSEFHLPSLENPEKESGGGRRERKRMKADEEERERSEWNFSLSTIVSSSSAGTVSDILGAIEFDPSDSFVATGGIARKIRIYSLTTLLPNTALQDVCSLDHTSACDYYMCTPAKLSSLRWRPGSGGRVIGSGDYDGVVMEYDLERKTPVFERDEHGGRRVWSVDYSHYEPVLGASGSDDGTMQMWDPRSDKGVAVVTPGGAVCSVEFSRFDGALVAVGCADRKAYGYDIRKMADPVVALEGHRKTVSYVRFLDAQTLVSAGTDGCLKLWNVNDSSLVRTYRGHLNHRSFVGLSVWRNGGLLGCGSENNKVFVYDQRWGHPIWVRGFGSRDELDHCAFVSSVCWRQQEGEDRCTLVAAGSDGVLQLFVGTRTSPHGS